MVGLETKDDAAVYQLREDLVLVQTVDFFTPIVDDPYMFGQVAAANALSDIYAMGADPLIALNVVAFPCQIGIDVLRKILEGGRNKVEEAGAIIIGGHTVDDNEPKYGLAVTGIAHPSEIMTISEARPGDILVLTKPIGIGILATALKGGAISEDDLGEVIKTVVTLNKGAKDAAKKAEVRACTDVTGFGLLGHLYEMISSSGVSAKIEINKVPIWERAVEFADIGMMPAGLQENKKFLEGKLSFPSSINSSLLDLLFDPQTSGGLLIAVSPHHLDELLENLKKNKTPISAIVGEVIEGTPSKILII